MHLGVVGLTDRQEGHWMSAFQGIPWKIAKVFPPKDEERLSQLLVPVGRAIPFIG
jgi:hypothetical protein